MAKSKNPINIGLTFKEEKIVGFAPYSNPHREDDFQEKIIQYDGDAPLLTIAPTGAGKGVSSIIPTALTHPDPMVIIDPKGEAHQVTADARRKMGHQVVCIDPFDYCGEGSTDGLNPLDLIDVGGKTAADDAKSLAVALSPTTKSEDPFWDQRSGQLFAGIILWIAAYLPKKDRHLGYLKKILNTDEASRMVALAAMATCDKWDNMVRDSAHILPDAPDKTRGSILTVAQQHAAFLNSEPVVASLSKSSVSLESIINGDPVTIYIIMPPERLESHAQLLRLWLTTIITAIARRRGAAKSRTLLMVDEAAQLGNLPALKSALTLMRGYGLTTWTFWQSLSQIQSTYPKDWQTIIDNAAATQAFGFYNHTFAEAMAKLTGYKNPESLSNMSQDNQLVTLKGKGAFICQRNNYLTAERYKGLYMDNPMIPANNNNRKVEEIEYDA